MWPVIQPVDRQAGIVVTLEYTRVLFIVDQDELKFAVSCQVSPQQEGETVLKCHEARGTLLLPRDVREVRHCLPLLARFIHIKDLLGLVKKKRMMVLRPSG